jgi:hypothetical protein
MTKAPHRRRSRRRELPSNIAASGVFVGVLLFALVPVVLKAGALPVVGAFVAVVVAAATTAMVRIRNSRSRPGEGTVATGGAAVSPVPPTVKLPPAGTMGPFATAICSALAQIALVTSVAATAIITFYGADPAGIPSPPPVEPEVEKPPVDGPSDDSLGS